jgi:hypothetical protein
MSHPPTTSPESPRNARRCCGTPGHLSTGATFWSRSWTSRGATTGRRSLGHVRGWVASLANARYLEALSQVADPAPAYHQVDKLAQPQVVGERSYAGFNPARREDVALFRAILQGDHLLHGFRNGHIRQQLFAATEDPRERRRQAAAVGRLLKRLHVRGLIAKVPRTRRWQVTTRGQVILGSCVRLYYHGLSTAA